jgi:hypothetical protein
VWFDDAKGVSVAGYTMTPSVMPRLPCIIHICSVFLIRMDVCAMMMCCRRIFNRCPNYSLERQVQPLLLKTRSFQGSTMPATENCKQYTNSILKEDIPHTHVLFSLHNVYEVVLAVRLWPRTRFQRSHTLRTLRGLPLSRLARDFEK